MCPKSVYCCPNGPKYSLRCHYPFHFIRSLPQNFRSLYCTPIILKSLPVLLHPQCNKRNNITIFLQKKKKKKNLKELFSKCHSQMMVTTESLFNIVYIITYTKKSTYQLKLIKTYLLIVIYLIRKGLISILNEVNEKVKGGLVSSCKIANL